MVVRFSSAEPSPGQRLPVFHVGGATITKIEELILREFKPRTLLPDWSEALASEADGDASEALDASNGNLLMSVHTWLVRDRQRTILIDTGVGNDKPRPFTPAFDHLRGPFLDRLAGAGVHPEDVDFVLMTHLHVDHVGWNTRFQEGQWRPTFPRAQYIFSAVEYAHFTNPANHSERNKTSVIVIKDSVAPIVEARQARMIKIDGTEIIDGFRFLPTMGHTIDHSSIVFTSGIETAFFVGDLLHHPLQVNHPELNSVFDALPEQARLSRRGALEYAADHRALVCTTHFPATSAGKVGRVGGNFEWRFCSPSP